MVFAGMPIDAAYVGMPSDATGDTLLVGYYSFHWRGGTFDVQLRNGGEFWCPIFPALATWSFSTSTSTLEIDWGKYGNYVLRKQGEEFVGGVRGDEELHWRRMCFKRSFTPQELLLSGSAWMMHFVDEAPQRVEFHADGRFRCPSAPSPCAFSYELKNNIVVMDQGMHGLCELILDVSAKLMTSAIGSALPNFNLLAHNAGTFDKLVYLEPLAAYIPPKTCNKGCCLLEDAFESCCKIGRKRGQLRQDECYESSPTSVTVRPSKLTSVVSD